MALTMPAEQKKTLMAPLKTKAPSNNNKFQSCQWQLNYQHYNIKTPVKR
jgi:hypothetical protein